jgi:hypothetical protein
MRVARFYSPGDARLEDMPDAAICSAEVET